MAGMQSLVDEVFGAGAIELALAESVAVRHALKVKAEEVQDMWVTYWESFPHPHSRVHSLRSGYVERPGDYSKSIRIKYMEHGRFIKARITAHDYKAHWIEYGAKHMPEFAPRAAMLSYFGGESTVSA